MTTPSPEPTAAPTKSQVEILYHTYYRASHRAFCGDSPDMAHLVSAGLMRSLGKASWCPDEYFTITEAGIAALAAATDPGRQATDGK